MSEAHAAGVEPAKCPGPAFDTLAVDGERLLYVVTVEHEFFAAQQIVHGYEIRHPVLANGADVIAAGELDIAQLGSEKIVLYLSRKSGHYQPDASCLIIVESILVAHGYEISPEAIHSDLEG